MFNPPLDMQLNMLKKNYYTYFLIFRKRLINYNLKKYLKVENLPPSLPPMRLNHADSAKTLNLNVFNSLKKKKRVLN
jgi:hypothetical protein